MGTAWLGLVAGGCIVDVHETEEVVNEPGGPGRPDDPEPTAPNPADRTFAPVAVGIGFDGVIRSDGTLEAYYQPTDDGPVEATPAVILSFAGERFFTTSDPDERDANLCSAYGTFAPDPLLPEAYFATIDGGVLFGAWDAVLTLEAHDCAGKVDPATWGEDAALLYGPFDGARVGIGFGPMTDFLREQWTDDALEELGPAMVAEYVALRRGDGSFVGEDWTTGVAFAWDPASGEPVVDGDGDLVPVPVPEGGPLPEAYVRSFSWWYEDLVDFDLDALRPE